MKVRLLLLPILLVTGLAAQETLPDLRVQNSGGTVLNLREVKLLRVEPDGLKVMHAAGTAKVPYELLPEELQVKYGFTAAKVQEHRQAVAAAAAQPSPARSTVATPAPAPATVPYATAARTPIMASRQSASLSTADADSSSTSVPRRALSSALSTTSGSSCGSCSSSFFLPGRSPATSSSWGTRPSSTLNRSSSVSGSIYIYPY